MVRQRARLVLAALLAVAGGPGCLLDTGTINKRPSVVVDEHATLHRGETVTFSATITDRNDKLEAMTVEWWLADTCDAPKTKTTLTCDGKKKPNECPYSVPTDTKAGSLCVFVKVIDPYSANATASRPFDIENRAPVATLDRQTPTNDASPYPLLTRFEFSGKGSSDPDGDTLIYKWTLKAPEGSTMASDCAETGKAECCAFTADVPGDYTIVLKVTDSNDSSETTKTVTVAEDRPPCISTNSIKPSYRPQSLTPAGVSASQTIKLVVDAVFDDVHPFPAATGRSPGTFTWSTRKGTDGDFIHYANYTSNELPIPEGTYQTGDLVQFRVEYQDGSNRSLASCVPEAAVCSLNHDDCAQWITWTVLFQ